MTTTSSEHIFALIAQWEYQCCGDPIDVGTTIDLTLTQLSEGPLPGPEGQLITWYVEHHVPQAPMRHIRARAVRLWEWRVRREERDGDGTWYPISGTEEFTPIKHMKVWDQAWQPTQSDARPEGWAIELEVSSELEPQPRGIPYGV